MRIDTGGAPWWLALYLVVYFIVIVVALVRWRIRDTEQLLEGVPMGSFSGLAVKVVHPEGGGRMVAMVFPDHIDRVVIVTPTQARQLSEWLRIAAGKAAVRSSLKRLPHDA